MEAPEPGIYPSIPFEDYTRWNAVNHSILRHFDKTPQHARWQMLHPEESSPYQELGHALHTALLEPDRFAEQYVVAPDVDRRTNVGKAAWAKFLKEHPGAAFITETEMECLEGIRENARKHETVAEALFAPGGLSELSLVWIDPESGVLCKGRLDRLTSIGGYPFIVDVKTTHAPASLYTWQSSVEKYKLHQQAAHYRKGLQTLRPLAGGLPRKFAWLVCETTAPYAVRIFEADSAALDIGDDQVAKHLEQYRTCVETGNWPAWDQGMELAGLPPWVMKRYDVE